MEVVVGLVVGLFIGAGIVFWIRRRQPEPLSSAAEQRRRMTDSARSPALADVVSDSLEAVDLAVLVFGSQGEEIYRNPAGQFPRFTRPTRAVIDGEIRDSVAEVLQATKAGAALSTAFEREVDIYGPPRAALTVRALAIQHDDPGGVVVIVNDATKERQLDEVRRSFVANVSHELRTPVGAIAVLAETLTASEDPTVIKKLGTRLQEAALRLGDMIEDLLELSRTESGTVVKAVNIDVASFIGDAVSNLSESAATAGVAVTVNVTPPSILMRGDARQLRSAVQNLVDNAIKYSGSGSEVRVDAAAEGDKVTITVADEGIGIPESALERIYERFYRVDGARRRQTGGTGLGLSIVRHVVSNHDGVISADSVEGEGTTFR
ncbi:MAG: hypothetical protein KJO18_03020, partial [Acidimicrobiia bacterium]|nr:hypothetical protein [Acidimicrobiia bacterium]